MTLESRRYFIKPNGAPKWHSLFQDTAPHGSSLRNHSFSFKMLLFNSVSVCGYMHVYLGASRGQNHGVFLKLELTGVCDPPAMELGTQLSSPPRTVHALKC